MSQFNKMPIILVVQPNNPKRKKTVGKNTGAKAKPKKTNNTAGKTIRKKKTAPRTDAPVKTITKTTRTVVVTNK